MNQLSLLPETPIKPWPEEIVESLNGQMTAIAHRQGRLYCVRDWVYVVSGSTSRNRNNPLNDLKRALTRRGEWNRIYDSFIEAPNPATNHRVMAFANDVGLYEVTIRLDDRAEEVRRVKTQMARSLAFQDWARRHPDQASAFFAQLHANGQVAVPTKPPGYYRLRHAGFTPLEAEQVLRERARLKTLFKEATATWQSHGAVGGDFPRLVNAWSQVVKGKTATQIKRELGLTETPWNYDSALDLVLHQILAIVSRGLHDQRQSQGFDALARDIADTQPTLLSVRDSLAEQFSTAPRPLPLKQADQLQLLAPGSSAEDKA
jgi:hypothetical protein